MFIEVNQIHNFMSSSDSGTVINYGSGSDFLTTYGSGSTTLITALCIMGGGGDSEQRSRSLVLGVGGSGKTGSRAFFPDSGSDRDSDETFQISRNLGLQHVEFFCLLDSQLWSIETWEMLNVNPRLYTVYRMICRPPLSYPMINYHIMPLIYHTNLRTIVN
jgi:hypothetical protein